MDNLIKSYTYNHREDTLKATHTLVGAIPIFGSAINAYVIDKLLDELPDENVNNQIKKELINLKSDFDNNDISQYEYMKNITTTLLNDQIPDKFKFKYIPECLDNIVKNMESYNECINNLKEKYDILNEQLQNDDNMKDFTGLIDNLKQFEANMQSQINNLKHINNQFTSTDINIIKNNISDIFTEIDKEKNIIECNHEYYKNFLKDIASYNNDMMNLWNKEFIHKYRNYNGMVDLTVKYNNYIEQNDHKSAGIVMDKMRQKVAKINTSVEKFNTGIEFSQNIFGSGVLIGKYFCKNNDIVRLASVGLAMTSVAKTLGSMAIGLTNPFTACVSVAGIIGSVVDMFNNNNDNGEQLQEMFKQLFDFLTNFRKEMHERFDIIDNKLDNLLEINIIGLSTILDNQVDIKKELMNLSKKMDNIEDILNDKFSDIEKNLKMLHNRLEKSSNYKLLEDIINKIYSYINEDVYQYDNYIKRMSYLKTHTELSAFKYVNLPVFENLNLSFNPVDSDFKINFFRSLIKAEKNTIPNITLFCMLSLCKLLLIIKQYPSNKVNILSRITKFDINILKNIIDMGNNIRGFISKLKKWHIRTFLNNYKSQLVICVNEMKNIEDSFNKNIKEMNMKEYNNTFQNYYLNLVDINRFKQEFPITTCPEGSNWHKLMWFECWNNKGYGGQHWGQYRDPMGTKRNQIEQETKEYIKKQKNDWINSLRYRLANPQYTIAPNFLYPSAEQNGPLLIFSHTNCEYPDHIITACQMNICYLRAEYTIIGKIFRIIMYAILNNNEKIKIGEMGRQYHSIYQGYEAIWWYYMGGEYEDRQVIPEYNVCVQGGRWGNTSSDIWNVKSNYPIRKLHEGAINNTSCLFRCSGMNINKNIIEQKIKEKEKNYLPILNKKINIYTKSKNGNILNEKVNLIYDYIAHTMRDNVDDKDIMDYFTKNDFITCNKLYNYYDLVKKDPNITDNTINNFEKLYNSKLDCNKSQFKLLDFIIEISNSLINYYDNPVKYNKWYICPEKSVVIDEMLKETSSAIFDILNIACKGDTVNSSDIKNIISEMTKNISENLKDIEPEKRKYLGKLLANQLGLKTIKID